MKVLTYALFILAITFACAGNNSESNTDGISFRTHHIKVHQQHHEFVQFHERFIIESLDKLQEFLKDSVEIEIVMAQWRVSRDFSHELYHKNTIYIEDCIRVDETLNCITDMQRRNLPFYTEFTLNEVSFINAIEMGYYRDAMATVEAMELSIRSSITAFRNDTEAYLYGIDLQ